MNRWGQRPGLSGQDWSNSSQLEHCGPPSYRYAPNELAEIGHGNHSGGVSPVLHDLLNVNLTSSNVTAVRVLATQVLDWQSFSIGVIDGLSAQQSVFSYDYSRLAKELVLADVYDQRSELLPQSMPQLENRAGLDSWAASLVEGQLVHACHFRQALVNAVCEAIQYPRDHTAALKETHRDRWLEFHRLSSSKNSASQSGAGLQFGHLLAATFETISFYQGIATKLHHLALRWPKLKEALALLQWEAGSVLATEDSKTPTRIAPRYPATEMIDKQVGQPKTHVPATTKREPISTCADKWKNSEEQTDKIAGISDPVKRNKAISAKYAEMYQKDNRMLWSGTAAFASKQVGCGLEKAKSKKSWPFAVGKHAGAMYTGLGVGNKAVFEEIYPVMEFYQAYGLESLKECASSRDSSVAPALITAIKLIEAGQVKIGAREMLEYEQSVTLQKEVYGRKDFVAALDSNKLWNDLYVGKPFGAEKLKLSFTSECAGGEEVTFEGKALQDFNERMVFAQKVADKFTEISTSDPAFIHGELAKILSDGGG